MLTIFITPNVSVRPLAMRNSSAAENRPLRVWVRR